MEICLKNGKHEDAKIPLHLLVRFDDNIVARNSYEGDGVWTGEEGLQNLPPTTETNPVIAGKLKKK